MRYKFPCGCSFPVLVESNDPDKLPLLDFNVEEIDLDCKATWELLGKGITKGVFQLESNLGKGWTKKLKPDSIEQLGALGSLLRPGCLRAIDERAGCSMTELYCRRRHGLAKTEYIHPCLEQILGATFGVLTYQEQAMEIARVVAGFTLQEADELRKAIGKKLAEEMAKVKIKFFAGAKKAGIITEEQAVEIFGWIEKSQRYSFNKSHAISYGINGYISAFLKTHFPVQFYCSWLYYAKDKQDPRLEIKELVNDAKLLDVEINPPDICNMEPHFSTDGKTVTFGLSNIKGIGEAQIVKLKEAVEKVSVVLAKPIDKWTWYETLVFLSPHISSGTMTRLISVGALRKICNRRGQMLSEYEKWDALTIKEQTWIQDNSVQKFEHGQISMFDEVHKVLDNFVDALRGVAPTVKEGGGTFNDKRKQAVLSNLQLLEKKEIKDNPDWIARTEEQFLGIAISCNKIDSCDINEVNCTCKEYLAGRDGTLIFGVEIETVKEVKVKNGKQIGRTMAFLSVSDGTCAVEMTAFPDAWQCYSPLLTPTNTVVIQAKRDKRKESLIVEKVYQC